MPVGSIESTNSYSPAPGEHGDPGAFDAARGSFNFKDKTSRKDTAPPSPPANAGSADWQKFQAGSAKGDAPPDLQPPPGTTAQDVANLHPGLIENINKMKWEGKGEGDIFAQQHGFKDLKDMLSSKSPDAAKATAELAWDAQAANNATKADGVARPDAERTSDTLSGIRDSGEVDPGSTGAILQDKIVHGQSMDGKTTFATKRTYEDGESISNAKMVGNRIADVFKKILGVICPPLADLVQMAQDGATKIRDEAVGDKDAADHDSKAIKEDGKNFGKDFGEFALNFIPGAGEVAGAVAKVAETVGKVVGDVAKTGGEVAGKAVKSADEVVGATENGAKSAVKSVSDAMGQIKDKLFGNDFMRDLVGQMPKDATREEKADYVRHKVEEVVDNVVDQIDFSQFVPSSSTEGSNQESSNDDVTAVLSQIEAEVSKLKLPQAG